MSISAIVENILGANTNKPLNPTCPPPYIRHSDVYTASASPAGTPQVTSRHRGPGLKCARGREKTPQQKGGRVPHRRRGTAVSRWSGEPQRRPTVDSPTRGRIHSAPSKRRCYPPTATDEPLRSPPTNHSDSPIIYIMTLRALVLRRRALRPHCLPPSPRLVRNRSRSSAISAPW